MKPENLQQRHLDYLKDVLGIELTKEQIIEMFASDDAAATDQIRDIHGKLVLKGFEYDQEMLDMFGKKTPLNLVAACKDLTGMFLKEKFDRMDPNQEI